MTDTHINLAAMAQLLTVLAQVRESAELAAEEQLEETTGRQLEEIDEQMRAWSRVSISLVSFVPFLSCFFDEFISFPGARG